MAPRAIRSRAVVAVCSCVLLCTVTVPGVRGELRGGGDAWGANGDVAKLQPQQRAERAVEAALTDDATDDDGTWKPIRQKLDSLWTSASKSFSTSSAGTAHNFHQSVATGVRSQHHSGSPPTPADDISFDKHAKVLLTATNAYDQMDAFNSIADSYVQKLEAGLLGSAATGNVSSLFADGLNVPFSDFYNFLQSQQSNMVLLAGDGGVAQGGGGLGFGLHVLDCNGAVVLTMTGSVSWGYKVTVIESSIYPDVTGGIGGGAQIFMGAKPSAEAGVDAPFATVLGVGGGGGGSVVATNNQWQHNYTASPIDGQIVTNGGDLDAIFKTVHSTACAPLSLAGGGGGGGGFLTSNSAAPNQDLLYGANAAYTYSSTSTPSGAPSPFEPAPLGAVAREWRAATDDDNSGSAVGDVIASCRKTCLVSGTAGSPTFFACFCPCLKQGIESRDLAWPHKIVCAPPSLRSDGNGYDILG